MRQQSVRSNTQPYKAQPLRQVKNNIAHLQPRNQNSKAVESGHILVISDSAELSETLQSMLFHEGYRVTIIHDGLRGLLAVKRYEPDLVLVDWAPPRLAGLEICQRLRSNDRKKPIVLLTRQDTADERIEGFKAGADDCISPPFDKEEFVSRINARLLHLCANKQKEDTLRCADLLLNRKTREVFCADKFVRLTAKEFDLLEYLMINYFIVVTRTQIIENVWGYDYVGSSNIVEVYIRYLRAKLKAAGDVRLIQTVRSVGYILRDT